ncbi:MAG: alanine racemase [Anaerolineae bacterium]|nr:alanine racemase [Anaerolineae bacterium]
MPSGIGSHWSAHYNMMVSSNSYRLRPTWVEISPQAIAHNVRRLKQIIGTRVALMAVVKADGYGHGAITAARTALANGASHLAVANLEEAIIIREAGIRAPILILSYTPIEAVPLALAHDLTLTVYDASLAAAYHQKAQQAQQQLRVHLKIDTGMGRLGLLPAALSAAFASFTHLDFEGIYTHFSVADENAAFTAEQVQAFRRHVEALRAPGMTFRYVHAANSAGTLASPDNHFDLVRVGLALYGLSPSETVPAPPDFMPAMTWKSLIASVKTLPASHTVGYGNTYVTQRETLVAVIPVGYADGLRRAPAHQGEVLVRGQRAPIIGRVSMEKTIIDVSHIPDVHIGDEVVLLGAQGDERISAEEIGRKIGTINYEVVCSILPRVPRVPADDAATDA